MMILLGLSIGLALSLILAIYVIMSPSPFVDKIGVEVNSAQRWIDLFFLPRFQPIEIVKPFLIILISLILSTNRYSNIYFKYFW